METPKCLVSPCFQWFLSCLQLLHAGWMWNIWCLTQVDGIRSYATVDGSDILLFTSWYGKYHMIYKVFSTHSRWFAGISSINSWNDSWFFHSFFPWLLIEKPKNWSFWIFFGQDPFTGWTTVVPPMRSYQHHPVEVGQNDRERNLMVSNMFYFHPYLEKWSNLTNFFQMGWNHQLGKIWLDRRSLLEIDNVSSHFELSWLCAYFSHTLFTSWHGSTWNTGSFNIHTVTSKKVQHPKNLEFVCWLISWSHSIFLPQEVAHDFPAPLR